MKRLIQFPLEYASILKRHRETGMGYHVVSVTLKNGKRFDQVLTSEGCVIQVRGHRDVPFTSEEVAAVDVNHNGWNFREPCRAR
jgi:hypothetical protein